MLQFFGVEGLRLQGLRVWGLRVQGFCLRLLVLPFQKLSQKSPRTSLVERCSREAPYTVPLWNVGPRKNHGGLNRNPEHKGP